MKTVQAINKNVRISPYKIRVVAKQIKSMSLKEAREYLGLSQKKAAGPLLKTINSAVANAVNNESMDEGSLKVTDLQIGESMTYRKPKYRARGRMDIMRSTFSHIRVQVGAVVEDENEKIEEKENDVSKDVKVEHAVEKKETKRTEKETKKRVSPKKVVEMKKPDTKKAKPIKKATKDKK